MLVNKNTAFKVVINDHYSLIFELKYESALYLQISS